LKKKPPENLFEENDNMRPSGDIPEYPPPKARAGAVKRPTVMSSSQESDLQRAVREELSHCIEERNEYRKQLLDTREELIQSRAVAQTLQSYFRDATGRQPDMQKFVLDSIMRLKEMEQMRAALLEKERTHREFEKEIQIQFKTQLSEKEKEIRANLQRQVDTIVGQEKQRRVDVQYELEAWQKHAEALRKAMRNMRTHHNNLVLRYEALRTRRTLRDVTNAPADDEDENTGIVWMEIDAQLIGEADEDEKE
jgi:hypothetical protein